MESFLNGVLLGYGVCVPVGPVNVMIMSFALARFKYGFALGLGAMLVDVGYLALLLLGVLQFADSPAIIKTIAIFGAIFLTYIAYQTFKSADKLAVSASGDAAPQSLVACFLKGVVANALNPFVIIFWLSVAGFAAQQTSPAMSLAGLLVAIFSWIFCLPLAVSQTRRLISTRAAKIIAYASAAVILLCVGLLLKKTFF